MINARFQPRILNLFWHKAAVFPIRVYIVDDNQAALFLLGRQSVAQPSLRNFLVSFRGRGNAGWTLVRYHPYGRSVPERAPWRARRRCPF